MSLNLIDLVDDNENPESLIEVSQNHDIDQLLVEFLQPEPEPDGDEDFVEQVFELLGERFGLEVAGLLETQGFAASNSTLKEYSEYLASFWIEAYWDFYGAAFLGILFDEDAGWPEAQATEIVKSSESLVLDSLDWKANHAGPEIYALISDLFSQTISRAYTVGFKLPDVIGE